MTWHTLKNGKEEVILAGFHLRFDSITGKGEIQPGGWYSTLPAPNGTDDAKRAALVQAGYERIERMLTEYRADALAMGVVIAPETTIG